MYGNILLRALVSRLEFSDGEEINTDSDNQETLRQDAGTNKILEAINGLRTETFERLDSIDRRLFKLEREAGEIKDLQLTFDARLDRLEAMAYESLQVAYSVRADVKVLRAEVMPGLRT